MAPDSLLLSPSDFPPDWRLANRDDQGWQVLQAWGASSNPGEFDVARFYSGNEKPASGMATALTNGTVTLLQSVLRFDRAGSIDAFLAQADRCKDGTFLANERIVIRLAVLAETDEQAIRVQQFGVQALSQLDKFRDPCQ